jgi:hypothetical protein
MACIQGLADPIDPYAQGLVHPIAVHQGSGLFNQQGEEQRKKTHI